MAPNDHPFLTHPEMLLMSDLTAGNVHLLRQTTPTDLRNPVGQHIRRTIEATDPVPPVDPAFWRGLGFGLLASTPLWALIGGVVWVFYNVGAVMQ